MKRILWVAAVLVAVLAVWGYSRAKQPVAITAAIVERGTITSTLITNGRAEPVEWTAIRAGTQGLVTKVAVERGQTVREGAPIVYLDSRELAAALSSAEARTSAARTEIETIQRGGRPAELVEIESSMARARADLEVARRELSSLERLVKRNAAAPAELKSAQDRVNQIELQLKSLEQRRTSLVAAEDRALAEAKLQEAQSETTAARARVSQTVLRAPLSGVLYSLDVRQGEWVNPGAQVARVGRLERMRVTVYVDEPELGRVSIGMPVTITWDALPGREWKGTVERVPTEVITLQSRQVGEVACIIDNSELRLLPGTNVNAEILSRRVDGALTIPKEALRRTGGQDGVLVIENGRLAWRPVRVGVSSVTRIQIVEGLNEKQQVALAGDRNLHAGMEVELKR